MRKVFSIFMTLCLLLASCSADRQAASVVSVLHGPTMGTTYQVQVPGLKKSDHSALQRDIDNELRLINAAMSTWQPDSDISRFNESRSTQWLDVSEALAHVVQAALRMAVASGGAFDPTVGPLVGRWGFGSQSGDESIPPSDEELSQLLSTVGFRHLHARIDPPALRKNIPELSIDLSAIAKGYAVDRVAQIVSSFGYENHLVEIGGELRIGGFRNPGTPWRIGVEQPAADGSDVGAALLLTGGGVASSGDYRNFQQVHGRRYSHIIDPRNGMPVDHDLAAVTVVANTAMHADGLATALMVMGAAQGAQYATQHSLAVRFIEHRNGRFIVTSSALYRQLPAEIRQ